MVTPPRGGEIIPLQNDQHQALRELLPWHVTGQLDAADQARVEAHLADCAECQADVRFQRRLEAEVARLPVDVEQGWSRMRQQLEGGVPSSRPTRRPAPVMWMGWAVAASLVLAVGGAAMSPTVRPALYHALGAAPAAEPGNVVMIFRPETPESRMRAAFRAADARLVDGPTAADAYVLRVPSARRAAILADLRTRSDVVLAEPVDAGLSPP